MFGRTYTVSYAEQVNQEYEIPCYIPNLYRWEPVKRGCLYEKK